MKGAATGEPGQVMIVDFPEPDPGAWNLVVEALACGICSTDLKLVKKGHGDLRYALGHEMVGRVLKVPSGSHIQVGQRVALAPYMPCGSCYYCLRGQYTLCTRLYEVSYLPGGLAERVLVPGRMAKDGMILLPDDLTNEMAALAEPLLGCVVKGMKDSHLQPGDALIVIGDGPMGQLTAAAGKIYGASPIIVAGMNQHRLAIARQYYADLALDVCQNDLRRVVMETTGGRGVDVVIVAVSLGEALQSGVECVRPGGTVNMFAGVPEGTHLQLDVRKLHYQQYRLTGSFGTAPVHMREAIELLRGGKVNFAPVISACFPFEQVEEAVRYMQTYQGLKALVTFPDAGG